MKSVLCLISLLAVIPTRMAKPSSSSSSSSSSSEEDDGIPKGVVSHHVSGNFDETILTFYDNVLYPDFTGVPAWNNKWNQSLSSGGCTLNNTKMIRKGKTLRNTWWTSVNGTVDADHTFWNQLKGAQFLNSMTMYFHPYYCSRKIDYSKDKCLTVDKKNETDVCQWKSMALTGLQLFKRGKEKKCKNLATNNYDKDALLDKKEPMDKYWARELFGYPDYESLETTKIVLDKIDEAVKKSRLPEKIKKEKATCFNSGRDLVLELCDVIQDGINTAVKYMKKNKIVAKKCNAHADE